MKMQASLLYAGLAMGGLGWAARCTTVLDASALKDYQSYMDSAEEKMAARFGSRELAWVTDSGLRDASAELNSGRQVRRNVSDPAFNLRIAERNATVIDWIGAIRIRNSRIEDLLNVLQDYDRHGIVYDPMIFASQAHLVAGSNPKAFDVKFGLRSSYRGLGFFPQHYTFEVKARTLYSSNGEVPGTMLLVHSRSNEIRESESGIPGRKDLLEPFHDHGILWALNTYWRARQSGPDLYVEFQAITLARSVEGFQCKIGMISIPKLVVSGVMDSIPSESLELMLRATKIECERIASKRIAVK